MIEDILFENYRKETSERSDESNWAKKILIEETPFSFDSIEGCNQNTDDLVTHIFERARVNIENNETQDIDEIFQNIVDLEGKNALIRKINFAKCYGINLSYVIYCNETQDVFLFEIPSIEEIIFIKHFKSYDDFSNWLSEIKGWKSTKPFRERDDLPDFDKELRKRLAPWPTNIDCFVASEEYKSLAILEFQNAHKVGLLSHCNNEYFWGITGRDDQRRWHSQEILRVQSGLPFFIIVWSAKHNGFKFKEIEKVVLPLSLSKNQYFLNKGQLERYVKDGCSKRYYDEICENMKTFKLIKENGTIKKAINNPPLSIEGKTFPMIYYKQKIIEEKDKSKLINIFNENVS